MNDMNKKGELLNTLLSNSGDDGRIRTLNPRSRNPIFYPVELHRLMYYSLIFLESISTSQIILPLNLPRI